MAVWRTSFWIWTSWVGREPRDSPLLTRMADWRASNKKKCIKRPLLSAEGCHTPPGTRSCTQQNTVVCRGQEDHKAVKAFWGQISRQILDLGFCFKRPMSPQDTGRRLEENPGIVSLRQFWVIDIRTLKKESTEKTGPGRCFDSLCLRSPPSSHLLKAPAILS